MSGKLRILTMQFLLSEFGIGVSLPNIKAIAIADALARHFVDQYGIPRIVLSDRGRSFQIKLSEELS